MANALVARYPECAQASEDAREGGLCHRLDIETSGVMLAARTREAWTAVREAFGGREVDKRYWALVTGPLADEGEIDVPLRHHPRHPDRVEPALEGEEGAREAHSEFRVLGRSGEYSLVEVRISHGRAAPGARAPGGSGRADRRRRAVRRAARSRAWAASSCTPRRSASRTR